MKYIPSLVRFIKALPEHCWLIYEWANDPITRKMSFNGSRINSHEHYRWFRKNQKELWIIRLRLHDFWQPVGLIRLDPSNEISINMAPNSRYMGIGSIALKKFLSEKTKDRVSAKIKSTNVHSKRIFEKVGFEKEKVIVPFQVRYPGYDVYVFND